jgi:hypothetical protein
MQGLARLQAAAVEHVAPHGEEGLGQRGRLDVAQALGHRQALAHRRHAQLGITATGHQRADAVADLEAGRRHRLGIAGHDLAGHFQAGNVGRARRHRVVAGALQHVGPVHAAGLDADQHLAGTRGGLGARAQRATPRRAVGGDFDGFHGVAYAVPSFDAVGASKRVAKGQAAAGPPAVPQRLAHVKISSPRSPRIGLRLFTAAVGRALALPWPDGPARPSSTA